MSESWFEPDGSPVEVGEHPHYALWNHVTREWDVLPKDPLVWAQEKAEASVLLQHRGNLMLTELHGQVGCDPDCEARYHGVFHDFTDDEELRAAFAAVRESPFPDAPTRGGGRP